MNEVTAASYNAILAATTVDTRDVTLSKGGKVSLRGVKMVEIFHTLRSFPKLREVILNAIGAGDAAMTGKVGMFAAFLDAGPEALAALITKACGANSDPEFAEALLSLPDEDLDILLSTTIELTAPEGIASFFGRFAATAARLGLLGGAAPSSAAA